MTDSHAEMTVSPETTSHPSWGSMNSSFAHLKVLEQLMAGAEILHTQLPSPSDWSPEKRLAGAVLAGALLDVRDNSADPRRERVVRQALAWIRSSDTTWPFSFLRLCELFALEADWVRSVAARWIREGRSSHRSPTYRRAA